MPSSLIDLRLLSPFQRWLADESGQGERDKMAGGLTVSVAWLRGGRGGPVQADRSKVRFWSVSSDQVGGFKSLQGRGRKLPHTPLGQEGALDGLQLWSGLGVLQGRVGGCHRPLTRDAKSHILLRNLQF